MLSHVAIFCYMFRQHFPMKVDYRESRHFCVDPVCPDLVRKLSKYDFADRAPTDIDKHMHSHAFGVYFKVRNSRSGSMFSDWIVANICVGLLRSLASVVRQPYRRAQSSHYYYCYYCYYYYYYYHCYSYYYYYYYYYY